MSAWVARASRSRTVQRLKSTPTAAPARRLAPSPSTSAPGATCIRAEPANTALPPTLPDSRSSAECQANALLNTNVIKKDVSFFEVYGKVNYTFSDYFSMGGNVYYTPSFLNTRRRGHLCFDRRQGDRAGHLVRRQRCRHVRVG